MVMRRVGSSIPLLAVPERIRSLASLTAAPGSPTIVMPGSPGRAWASTRTGIAFQPDKREAPNRRHPHGQAPSLVMTPERVG